MKCIPKQLVEPLHDRIAGSTMGGVKLTPPVDEKISDLSARTVAIGLQFLAPKGAEIESDRISVSIQEPQTQRAELFSLSDLTKFWNPDWKLERAGFGGAGGGIGNIRGITHLEGDVLATWPRDPVRGVVLRRSVKLGPHPTLSFQAGADPTRAWQLEVYAGNERLAQRLIDGGNDKSSGRKWHDIQVNIEDFSGKEVQLRLYQRVLLPDRIPGNAYWRNLQIK
jgi:hypothetical protein